MQNQPYVKQFNELAQCTNPIVGNYPTLFPNQVREFRKAKSVRFVNNRAGAHVVAGKEYKYHKHIQLALANKKEFEKGAKPILKRIEHYLLKK